MKTYKTFDPDFCFTYPDDWNIEKEKNIITAYNASEGIGALQFSLYEVLNPATISLTKELESFLSNRHDNFKVYQTNNYASSNAVIKQDAIWKYWLFLKKNTIIFITYNCLVCHFGKEEKEVELIIRSLVKC